MSERDPEGVVTGRRTALAAVFLAAVLAIGFAPAIFAGRTLLHASWDAPSVTSSGAFEQGARPLIRLQRTSDPGASAWQTEAWYQLISDQFWKEFTLPLWNPYNAYGTPLMADAISQPFFPPAMALSLHVTPWTYNVFVVSRLLLGGLLMFLFARQFLTALPSLFAAVTFMLSGYFVIYLGIAHVSVEVLIPGVFLAFELLLRRNSWAAVGGVAAMILLGMAGGMPESLFLMLAFASLYFVCRILFTPLLRSQALTLLAKFAIAVGLGFALSGFLLLPFLEFLQVSHDVHQPGNVGGLQVGLLADRDYRLTLQYLLPLVFGPILNSIFSDFAGWSGLRGYWGIIPFFFSLVAVLTVVSARRTIPSSPQRFLTVFFALTLLLMVLKRFGNVSINWIGALPVSELVQYPKYQEPLMALCVAMLAGIGFAALIERRASLTRLYAALAITLAIMLVVAASFLPEVRAVLKTSSFGGRPVGIALFFYVSVGCGVALLIVLAALVWLTQKSSQRMRPWLLRGAVALLSLELLLNFLVPSFYLLSSLPPRNADPYRGAPYIDFIRAANTDHSRIFARNGVLFPNWSSAFGLADVRILDAMQYRRYRTFIRAFLLPPDAETRVNGDLADRFTGWDFDYEFGTNLEQRYLALSSVRYLIGDTEYGWSPKWLNDIVAQHRGENLWGFGADIFRVGDQARSMRVLFQHPPSARLSYRTTIDPKQPVFEATAVIKEEAVASSDGAGFRLELKVGDRIETLFAALLDPRNVPADRNGRFFQVDLSRHAGREVELLFSTDPGPAGDASADYAGWGDLRFVAKDGGEAGHPFAKLYDKEVRIHQVPWVLPRASIYGAFEILPDSDVLARLKDPSFDPNRKAIVSRESLGLEQAGIAQPLAGAAGVPVRAASITQYRSRQVRIEAESAEPALLVLNDTDFPGWRATVNGQTVPIVSANYLFRGVILPPGRSTVEFRYEPQSFQAGVGLSLAAFSVLALLMVRERRRRTRR